MAVTCPSCGKQAVPYDARTSDWCVPCTSSTLAEQEELRYEPQMPETLEGAW